MATDKDSVKSSAGPMAGGAAYPAQQPDAPLPRVWADPIGTGEPVAFDPELHEPPLSPKEISELLEK
jgi:hypothetical protein